MNVEMIIQYIVIACVVIACLVKVLKEFRKSASGDACAGGCSSCSNCSTTSKKQTHNEL